MRLSISGIVLAAATATFVSAQPLSDGVEGVHQYAKREVTNNGWHLDNKTYDYVIIGGGTAGLALAGRLSEDDATSVAVIEAGSSGYEDPTKFLTPDADLYDSSVGTKYDWQYKTTKQNYMNGRRAVWPRGKVLGGSSAINGQYYVRNSQTEQNIWNSLAGGNWGWSSFLSAMKKSESFSAPLKSIAKSEHIKYDASSHGSNGPIHTTWPAVTYKPIGAFIRAAQSAGTEFNNDPYNGQNWGTYVSAATIKKSDWTRSYSRTGYLDPVTSRSNLHVLTGHVATKIVFDQSNSHKAKATGVEYATSSDGTRHTVYVNKEVIVSGGAINTPQILQLSGIGSKSLLSSVGIDTVVNLPGVGENLQDHLSAGMSFKPKKGSYVPQSVITGDAKTDSYVNTAVSYVSLNSLFKDPDSMIQRIRNGIDTIVNNADVPSEVKAGQRKTYDAIANKIFGSDVAPVEILGNVMFGSINIQAALQHPLSRGSVKIHSKDPFTKPHVDPGYLSQDLDLTMLRQGFKHIRKIAEESPLKELIESEQNPGSDVQSNEQWEDWIRENGGTEYHPSGTSSMLPRNEGGVVNNQLKVYGTSNVRVVDASVPPISFSCHLMSVTYGIAEMAAEMIKNDN
ncbi:hypothetical protein MYAM1_002330 [Malassezia yamatoensis]|uniref:Glucose-methanol-choline oxidoreductase N-terminal domain-containing protein n=1 Tax=Malassezia yamatoensis TaxID=253288 RepID=A0AAJ5YSV9_9BASI|nr:hypothetical protein MYAM1_002330 [Malassezia yamatoensis]